MIDQKLNIEVHVAAMYQSDFSLYNKMNIKSDAIIANQCELNRYEETIICGRSVRLLSTNTRGVGKNRNLALLYSKGDIILFSDMDITYYDNYEETIINEFKSMPDADCIMFGLRYIKNGKFLYDLKSKKKRLHVFNSMKYPTPSIALKKIAINKYNLHFSEVFGGGCIYGSGEDSLFIRNLFNVGARVYSSDKIIGESSKDESSWFHGYDEKFMYDRGALMACCFPKTKNIIKWYFPFRLRRLTTLSARTIIQEMNKGIKGFETQRPYKKTRRVRISDDKLSVN